MSASSDPGVVDPPVDRWVIGFVHALRTRGVDVAVDSTITFAQALDAVGVGSRSAVYWAGRATLTHGAGASATIRWSSLGTNSNQGMLMFSGNDLGGTGTHVSQVKFNSMSMTAG